MGNTFKTAFLLTVLTLFLVWIGNLLGGQQGMILAFILALAMNFFSYWYSDKIVLRMYRAREVSEADFPQLYGVVRQLSEEARLPVPKVYIIPEQAPNAFATGRNPEHAVIAVTEGLLQTMSDEEATGVLAHEMAHIKNRDILIGTIAATMAGAIMILASMARWSAFFGGASGDDDEGGLGFLGVMVMSILAPLAAMMIQMAVSRSREYQADATGASLAGRSDGLANALEKLGAFSKRRLLHANPSTAHMFIVNPLSGGSMMNLFSTHPPIAERVSRLRNKKPDLPVSKDEDQGQKQAEAMWRHLQK
jgi:heat shock protein HtpX